MKKKVQKTKVRKGIKSASIPVTQKMLYGVRDQLKTETQSIRMGMKALRLELGSVRSEMGALKAEVKSEIGSLRSEMGALKAEVKSEIGSLRSEMGALKAEVKSDILKVSSEVHRLGVLIEEQNARNVIVLDGLTSLFHRQDRVEARLKEIEGR